MGWSQSVDGKTEVYGSLVPSGRARLELGLLYLLNCFLSVMLLTVTFSPLAFTPLVTQEEIWWPRDPTHPIQVPTWAPPPEPLQPTSLPSSEATSLIPDHAYTWDFNKWQGQFFRPVQWPEASRCFYTSQNQLWQRTWTWVRNTSSTLLFTSCVTKGKLAFIQIPQKVKLRIAVGPRDSTPRHTHPGESSTSIPTKTWTWMFVAALFIRAQRWKQPKCPSTDEWIKEIRCIHRMEYYSAVKNEILIQTTKWTLKTC